MGQGPQLLEPYGLVLRDEVHIPVDFDALSQPDILSSGRDVKAILDALNLPTEYDSSSVPECLIWNDPNGNRVGFVVLRDTSPNGDTDHLFAEWLWVDPSFRGQGVAQRMMQHVSEEYPIAAMRFSGSGWTSGEGPQKNMLAYATALGFRPTMDEQDTYERAGFRDRFQLHRMVQPWAGELDGMKVEYTPDMQLLQAVYRGPSFGTGKGYVSGGEIAGKALVTPGVVHATTLDDRFQYQGLASVFRHIAEHEIE